MLPEKKKGCWVSLRTQPQQKMSRSVYGWSIHDAYEHPTSNDSSNLEDMDYTRERHNIYARRVTSPQGAVAPS